MVKYGVNVDVGIYMNKFGISVLITAVLLFILNTGFHLYMKLQELKNNKVQVINTAITSNVPTILDTANNIKLIVSVNGTNIYFNTHNQIYTIFKDGTLVYRIYPVK